MAGRIGKEVAESQVFFHSWAWIPARRLVREKQEAPHEIDKSTRLLFVSFLSLSLSLSLSKHALPCFLLLLLPFLRVRHRRDRWATWGGPGLLLSSSGATSEADLQATLVGCHEYVSVALANKNRREARKENWNFLKKNRKRGKRNCPPCAGVWRLSLFEYATADLHGDLGNCVILTSRVPVTSFLPITLYEVFISALSGAVDRIF